MKRTAISDRNASCSMDSVDRQFKADRPNQFWLRRFTDVWNWQGWLCMPPYVRCLCSAHRCAGKCSSTTTDFVLDDLEQPLCARQLELDSSLVHHSNRG